MLNFRNKRHTVGRTDHNKADYFCGASSEIMRALMERGEGESKGERRLFVGGALVQAKAQSYIHWG